MEFPWFLIRNTGCIFFLREFMTVPLQLKEEGAKIDCLTTINIVDGKNGQFTYIKGAQIYIFKGKLI